MRKILVFVMIVLCVISLTSCGASWEQTKKNLKSDISGGIERKITVYDSRTERTLWEYKGKGYIDSDSKAGNFTVIYYDNGVSKKADFLGESVVLVSIEV